MGDNPIWGGPRFGGSPSTMTTLNWNCCGLGNPRTIRFLKEIVSQKRPKFIFLCETLCSKVKIEGLARLMDYGGAFWVEAQGRSGGLALLWKHKDDLSILSFSQHHIDSLVCLPGYCPYRLTGFYGEPNRTKRRVTWDLLRKLKADRNEPWCIIGDFNNVLNSTNKQGGNTYPRWLISGFQQVVQDCGFIDLDLSGHQFTWERGRGTSGWMEVWLNRALVSQDWIEVFSEAKLTKLGVSSSDHSPLFLEPVKRYTSRPKFKFRFENSWISEAMCRHLVRESWKKAAKADIHGKLQHCITVLSSWGRENTGYFKRKLQQYQMELNRYKQRRDGAGLTRYKEAYQKLFYTLHQQDVYWRQRAKQYWLQSGDQNNKYFHAMASWRRRNNQLQHLKNTEGVLVDWDSGLDKLILDYFDNIFKASYTD
ncbi:uncharacterized protein LOC133797433 [Humulus lupulus]|uniref:uncharacterized protein LOC133797433 n=1 Tax=Humulus lupulus TaxID=3486 RepID=UPI002B40613F|nr:uncharacterized protein LOC133797433 [Humulus lupulus]XP_062091312.1 uncharacterized protein LOC133797433 [Humulus lupulus]